MLNQRKPDLEISLCSRCAGYYYDSPSYWIERTDMTQVVHEECMLCKSAHGYSFRIWKNATVRTPEGMTNRTFVEEGRHE